MKNLKQILSDRRKAQAEKPSEKIELILRKDAENALAKAISKWEANQNAGKPKSKWVNFQIDKENETVIDLLIDYFRGDVKGKLDPFKGLLLAGNVGSGKTLLLDLFAECRFPRNHFGIIKCQTITEKYIGEGFAGIENYGRFCWRNQGGWRGFITCFDDLGAEISAKHFGNDVLVMVHIIQDRIDNFTKHGVKTHFTTNLDVNEIQERYGERTMSRLRQMCNIIYLGENENSKDRRK